MLRWRWSPLLVLIRGRERLKSVCQGKAGAFQDANNIVAVSLHLLERISRYGAGSSSSTWDLLIFCPFGNELANL